MDYVSWCDQILAKYVEAMRTAPHTRTVGVPEDLLGHLVYGEAIVRAPDYFESNRRLALVAAVDDLSKAGMLVQRNPEYFQITRLGLAHLDDPVLLWSKICEIKLAPDQAALLFLVNRLSPLSAENYTLAKWIDREDFEAQLGWSDPGLAVSVAQELGELGLLLPHFTMGGGLRVMGNYAGMVWETRRGFTLESHFIDALVAEWETTSVDFKRELHTDTADEKAELVKDLLGLVNTQASGRRWLIVGFDEKTRSYFGPPDPKITQNHLEQITAVYTTPILEIRYEIVDYRAGPVAEEAGRAETPARDGLGNRQYPPRDAPCRDPGGPSGSTAPLAGGGRVGDGGCGYEGRAEMVASG